MHKYKTNKTYQYTRKKYFLRRGGGILCFGKYERIGVSTDWLAVLLSKFRG